MASYHLDVKAVKRSAGRSATAAAAYRHAERIECGREGRVHDYRAKSGVEASFILAPEDAPAWAQDRQALWNAAEAREARKDGIVAREWELALPHELDASGRRALAESFARELVARYRVAADVAIHAPHREGDQRNWHAHVLTTTRALGPEGLGDKTRVLDVKTTGGPEIALMRERWAVLQNHALERLGVEARVDHRSLAVQRAEALALGQEARADNLDRAPEVKLGPVVSAIERREQRAAEREEREYVPVTERGAQVHEARQARSLLAELARVREALQRELQERVALARDTYAQAREDGTDRVRAGLAALRAAAQRQGIGPEHGRDHAREAREEQGQDAWQEREASRASIRQRLERLRGRDAPHHAQDGPGLGLDQSRPAQAEERPEGRSLGLETIRERLEALRERAQPGTERVAEREADGTDAIRERLRGVLARERTEQAHGEQERDPIRERLQAVLDRAKPVTQEREEPGHEHEGEREGARHRQRDHGWGYGL